MLAGSAANLSQRLQSSPNAAARLIFRIRRCDHITDGLIRLQRLRVPQRIFFKAAVQRDRSFNSSAPVYLTHVADVYLVDRGSVQLPPSVRHTDVLSPYSLDVTWMLGGVMVRASNLRSSGRGFDSRSGCYQAT